MNLLDTLDDLHGKATPGNWMHNQYYEMAHTHSAIHKLTPLLMYHPRNDRAAADMAHAVALHNAWPAISRALRAATSVRAGQKQRGKDEDDWAAAGMTVSISEMVRRENELDAALKALEGLVKP